MKFAIPAALMLSLASPAAFAADDAPADASIAFANHGGIDDWTATDDRTIYFEDRFRRWYRADLMGPCTGLDFAWHIGVDTGVNGSLDRWGAVFVDGQRCPFQSFVAVSGPPPERADAKRHKRSTAAARKES